MSPSAVSAHSLTAFVSAHAQADPDRPAVIFPGSAGNDEVLTYGGLAGQAAAVGQWLSAALPPGSRVLLALPTGKDAVVGFLGCLAGGMVAVHIPTPAGFPNALRRATGIAKDSEAGLIVARPADLAAVHGWVADAGLASLACESLPTLSDTDFSAGRIDVAADQPAFLQYTSGSTTDPRGVVITHASLLANVELCAERIGLDAATRFGGWIPLFHDMGLVTLLCLPLVLGGTTVLMQPAGFARRPVEWLRLIENYRLGMSAGPNFAYELCARTISEQQAAELDLSSWRFAINGSEPINVRAMMQFTAKFARSGFRPEAMVPGYGMAETTVFVSAKGPGTLPVVIRTDVGRSGTGRLAADLNDGRPIVSCGQPAGFDIRIVDPQTAVTQPAGKIGEIWLRGPSVSPGYWQRPEATAATFGAVAADGTEGWLRTGDLGGLWAGELYVTGRLKEVLIFRGRNLYPQDLEQEARAAHSALTGLAGAAFAVSGDGERPVIVHEVNVRAAGPDLATVSMAISERLTSEFGIPARNVVLVRRGAVRKTTSGKIERVAMRSLFLAGGLAPVHVRLEPAVADLLPASAPEDQRC